MNKLKYASVILYFSAIGTIGLALTVLLGWFTRNTALLLFPYPSTGMNPVTAVCFVLGAIAALLFRWQKPHAAVRGLITGITLLLLMAGAARLLDLLQIADPALDIQLFSDYFQSFTGGGVKGRMSFPAGFFFLITGTVLLLKLVSKKTVAVQVSLGILFIYALFSVLMIVYNMRQPVHATGKFDIYKLSYSSAICALLLSMALWVSEGHRGILLYAARDTPGGRIFNTFMPVVLLFPFVFSVIQYVLRKVALWGNSLGVALSATLLMVVFIILIFYTARSANLMYRRLLKEIVRRNHAVKEAEDARLFANTIFESLPNMVFVKEGESLRFKAMNKAWEALMGLKREGQIGKTDYDLFEPGKAEAFREKDREVFTTNEPVVLEESLPSPVLGFRWLRTKKVGVKDKNGKPLFLVGISEDITELKQQQDKLDRYTEDLEKEVKKRTAELIGVNARLMASNKELEQFAYITSHDLQEPLRNLLSFVDLIQEEYRGKVDENMDVYLDFIKHASGRMQQLVKAVLDYSRIGKEWVAEQTDINNVLEDMLADMQTVIKETAAVVTVATAMPVLYGREIELRQLFQNLISNAIKFRKIGVRPVVTIAASEESDGWLFAVQDNGIGIDSSKKDKVFEMFRRLHNRDDYDGLGIGLAHCKKIVELHGGKIWLSSIPGEGTTFYFTIPYTEKNKELHDKLHTADR